MREMLRHTGANVSLFSASECLLENPAASTTYDGASLDDRFVDKDIAVGIFTLIKITSFVFNFSN